MAKAQNRTVATPADPRAYIALIEDEGRRADAERLLELYGEITKQAPVMWGSSMIGFGRYHYRYASGREGEFFMCGFAPRKRDFSLYVMAGFEDRAALLEKLGPHSTGRSCLYVKRLADLHVPTLKRLLREDWREMVRRYGAPDS